MIKVFFLLFEPGATWDGIARARRGFSFILFVYLLPMIVISSAVEGWGLNRWGKWQPKFQQFKNFSTTGIVTFEAIQAVLLLLMVLVSALLLLKISQTFEHRRNYRQAFATMAYGYSPLFLAHLLDAGRSVNPMTSAIIGILLTVWVLYQGIPRVMQPDPTHAFGLYLSAMFVVILTASIARVLPGLFLLGVVDFKNSWLTHKFPALLQ
jgi:uncharacterized membrane protein YidH (DUF202 family)